MMGILQKSAKAEREPDAHGTLVVGFHARELTRVIVAVVPHLGVVREPDLIAETVVHLVSRSDGNRQVQPTIENIDVLSEVPAVKGMVSLKPHRLVLVLGPEDTRGNGHAAKNEDKSPRGACVSVRHEGIPFKKLDGMMARPVAVVPENVSESTSRSGLNPGSQDAASLGVRLFRDE